MPKIGTRCTWNFHLTGHMPQGFLRRPFDQSIKKFRILYASSFPIHTNCITQMNMRTLSVVIVNFNTAHLLAEMFESLYIALQGIDASIIIIDNASSDGSQSILSEFGDKITLIRSPRNIGFGRANNLALPLIKSEYVLLLNTDAFPAPDAIKKTIQHLDVSPKCGVAGVRLLGRNGELQPSCRYFPTPFNQFIADAGLQRCMPWSQKIDDMTWAHDEVRQCDWVPGCFLLTRTEIIRNIGLFDPRFFLYCEEVDFCKRVKQAGWSIDFIGEATCVHIGGESAATIGDLHSATRQVSSIQIESNWLYFRKHFKELGAMAFGGLSLFAGAIQAFRSIVKFRSTASIRAEFAPAIRTLQIGAATAWGTRPLH